MKDQPRNAVEPTADGTDRTDPLPEMVDRATWQAELDRLLVREKAHTREGDAIAAARRRLPMVEMDSGITLTGAHGPVTLLEVFEGRRQLIVYFHMWHADEPAEAQCEGCTFFNGQVRELSYLHSRDVTYATFCQGPYEESVAYRDFMGWDVPWYSASRSADALLAAAGSACRCATCGTVTGCSRPTGRAAAPRRSWPLPTGCSTGLCTADRRPGRTLRPAGPSCSGPAAISSAPTAARLPSGHGSPPDAPRHSLDWPVCAEMAIRRARARAIVHDRDERSAGRRLRRRIGPPLFLLHGGPAISDYMDMLVPAVDTAGAGCRSRPTGTHRRRRNASKSLTLCRINR